MKGPGKKAPVDPLANPALRRGLFESFAEALFGASRPFLCAQIESSSACLGKCSYCPQSSQAASWRSRHMRPEVFARLWPLLKLCSQAHLQGWGEPLLNPRFFDMAALAKRAGCQVSTTSCGLVMDEGIADKLLSGYVDLIAFSLAGTDQESNSSRAGVDFSRTVENIKFLAERRDRAGSPLRIHLAYILLADQLDALKRLPSLMAELGVDAAVVSTLDYLAQEKDRGLAFRPGEGGKLAQAGALLRKASAEAQALGKKLHWALPAAGASQHPNGCRENVRKTLHIDAEGNVSPCVYLNVPSQARPEKRRVFGNVMEEDPVGIWKKPEFKAFRQALLAGEPDPACLDCPKRLEAEGEGQSIA